MRAEIVRDPFLPPKQTSIRGGNGFRTRGFDIVSAALTQPRRSQLNPPRAETVSFGQRKTRRLGRGVRCDYTVGTVATDLGGVMVL